MLQCYSDAILPQCLISCLATWVKNVASWQQLHGPFVTFDERFPEFRDDPAMQIDVMEVYLSANNVYLVFEVV